MENSTQHKEKSRKAGSVLRNITGWSLLAAAFGTFFDAYACDGCAEGSIGLIPLYIGFPIGSVGLILLFRKAVGWVPAVLAALGLAGILIFMFSYPNNAEGMIGAILVGIAHLFLPLAGRFTSVLWVAAGILGFPAFNTASWGPLNGFTMFGAATAASGAFVLWGWRSMNSEVVSEESRID